MSPTSWADTLIPQISTMRAELSRQDIAIVATLTGAGLVQAHMLSLRFWDDEWLVTWPEATIQRADGQPCSADKEVTMLYYLTHGDGTRPAGRWISFHDLPNGMFYWQAFQGYSGNRLARTFVNNVEAFEAAAQGLGGTHIDLGDAMYAFWPLPRICLAAQYWRGDDEFPPRANILFDAAASHYLSTDGLAVLGSQLVSRLGKAPRAKYDM